MDVNDSSSSSVPNDDSDGSTELDEAVDSAVVMTVNLMMQVAQQQTLDPSLVAPIFRRRAVLQRRRVEAHQRLMRFYFVEDPVFGPREFRRRYRMSRRLFLDIKNDLEAEYSFFQQRYDARGKIGFSAIQKCTSALRQIAYGSTVDSFDENLEMSDRTCRESLKAFCKGTIFFRILTYFIIYSNCTYLINF